MEHIHRCYDDGESGCGRTIRTCNNPDCVLEPDEDVVYEQCASCLVRIEVWGDQNPREDD